MRSGCGGQRVSLVVGLSQKRWPRAYLKRHLDLGVECIEDGGFDFRLWSTERLGDFGGGEDHIGACGVMLEVLRAEGFKRELFGE